MGTIFLIIFAVAGIALFGHRFLCKPPRKAVEPMKDGYRKPGRGGSSKDISI